MCKLDIEKAEEPEIKLPTSLGSYIEKARELKKKKQNYFYFIDYAKPFDCMGQNKVENSSRDEDTRSPYLSPEKSVCMSRGNTKTQTWNNGLIQNWEKSTSRLYIITLLICAEYNMLNAG